MNSSLNQVTCRSDTCQPGRAASRWPILLAAVLLISNAAAGGDIGETLSYTDYPVNAHDSRSLGYALNHHSPIRQGGKTFHAYTSWRVSWQYRWKVEDNGSCRISEVSSEVNSTIQLPRLIGGSPTQQERFQRYLSALKEHELGHHRIGRQAAIAVRQKLQGMPAMNSCQRLVSAANRLAQHTVERFKEEERTYDLVTAHGRLQGAHLDY